MKLCKYLVLTAVSISAAVSSSAITPTKSLPEMVVSTENNAEIVSKENYIDASFYIVPNEEGGYGLGSAGSSVATEIRGRGNYTWTSFRKKPYKLKLAKKTELMGMDKNKHFALLAHADDNTGFLRNTIGFDLSRLFGLAWTPEQRPIQLSLNGSYDGLYFLTQTIRVDKTRVNIVEQPDTATAADEITGGWLVEIDNYDTDPHITVIEGGGSNYPIWFTYKTPEILSTEQTVFLSDQMETLNRLIYANDKTDSAELETMLDLDAFARYYLVQEVTDNVEAFHGSCYLYRNRGEGEKWTFGPVWDFGSAFQRGKNGRRIWQDAYHQVWVEELLKFPAVQNKVKEVWLDILEEGFDGLFEEIVRFENSISPAMELDRERWPDYGVRDYRTAWSQTMEMLKQNILEVGSWYGDVTGLAPTVYLRGDFNNWGLSTPFVYDRATGLYEVSVQYLDSPFKIATSDWSTIDYGAPDSRPVVFGEAPFNLVKKGSNIVPAQPIRESVMIFNTEEATLQVKKTGAADDVFADEDDSQPEYFTIDGRRVDFSERTKGIYIEKRGASVKKILRR